MWKVDVLEDACTFISRGISPKYIDEGGILVLNQKCVRNHAIDYSLARRHDIKNKSVKPERFIQRGDVLINSTGQGTLGRVAQVRQEPPEPTTVDSHITIVRPNLDKFYLEYFGYALIQIEEELKNSGQGTSGQTELAKTKVQKEFFASFPSDKAEQQRIVAKLDAAFAEIDRAVEVTVASIEQARIGLSNLIDEKTANQRGWNAYTISELGLVQTGNTPKTSDKQNYGSDIPFVKPPHFNADGTIEISGDGLSLTGAKTSRKAPSNSVMMVCIGATIGKVAVCHEEVCFNQQINALSPMAKYDAELIYWQMRGNRFQRDVLDKAGQATLPIISKAKWASLSIFLPSTVEAQVEIRNQLRGLSNQTDAYCSVKSMKIEQLKELKLAILAQELQPSEAA